MKLTKINLNELANADLNEREMCRLLGGAGDCQCSCAGSSTTGSNNSYNNEGDLKSTTASSGGSSNSEPEWKPPLTTYDGKFCDLNFVKNYIYFFSFLLLFINTVSCCSKSSNRIYFTINPEDRKILLPVHLDDNIKADMVFDTFYSLVLDSAFCANRPYLSLYLTPDTVKQEIGGSFFSSKGTHILSYENSIQALKIGNSKLTYTHPQVYDIKRYFNNCKLDGFFNIPQNDTINVWELNFEHNYLEIHPTVNFKMPDNCFILPMVEDIYGDKYGGRNAIKVEFPMQIECADGDTLTLNRVYYIDTGLPRDIMLMNATEEQEFFNKKEDAVWIQDGIAYVRYYTVTSTLFDNFAIDSLRIYTFESSSGLDGKYLIGQNFLKRFNVFFDMKNRKVGLQPIKNFQRIVDKLYRRFHYATTQNHEGKAIVTKIADYSSNYFKIAGIQEGDEIIAVNGLPYSSYSRNLLPIDTVINKLRNKNSIYEDRNFFKDDTLVFDIIRKGETLKIVVLVDKNEERGD